MLQLLMRHADKQGIMQGSKYVIRPLNKFEAILKSVNDEGATWSSEKAATGYYIMTRQLLDTWPEFWEDITTFDNNITDWNLYRQKKFKFKNLK